MGVDLLFAQAAGVFAVAAPEVPVDGGIQAGCEIPRRSPAKPGSRARGVELHDARLGLVTRTEADVDATRAARVQVLDDPPYGAPVDVGRPEVPGGRHVPPSVAAEGLGQLEVPLQGIEDVLPRPHRRRRTDVKGRSGLRGADEIGHQPVRGPVTATDDIARANRGHADVASGVKRIAERRRDDLLASLGGGVGIPAAERLVLAVGPLPLAVGVALVGRDGDHRTDVVAQSPDRVEHVHGPHDVRGIGVDRLAQRALEVRDGGEVEHHLRASVPHGRVDVGRVADIPVQGTGETVGDARLREQRVRRRL